MVPGLRKLQGLTKMGLLRCMIIALIVPHETEDSTANVLDLS